MLPPASFSHPDCICCPSWLPNCAASSKSSKDMKLLWYCRTNTEGEAGPTTEARLRPSVVAIWGTDTDELANDRSTVGEGPKACQREHPPSRPPPPPPLCPVLCCAHKVGLLGGEDFEPDDPCDALQLEALKANMCFVSENIDQDNAKMGESPLQDDF